ncbi:DUF6049 family protein [Microbacterium sp. NPDC076911]|uniref:DUF6049 family protein n=1 Tax=Microbacterium sp. NPDC076911 TaxID=3154958 RepID=UPI0034377906
MTVTTSGKPARRRTLSARMAAGFVAMLMGASLAIATPAVAATPEPTPTPMPTPEIPPGTTAFTLSPVGSGIVYPGDSLTVSVTLQNATRVPTEPVEVTLELGNEPIVDRRALTSWLDGSGTNLETSPVATTTLESVDAQSEYSQGMLVHADDPSMLDLASGVYPLVATYEDEEEEEVLSTSVMIIPDDSDAAETAVGVIVPITAPSLTQGLLTSNELTALTSANGSLSNQLKAVEGTPAILAIDPAIVAAIRVLGTAAPDSAVEWLNNLMTLPNSRFALQFGDADVAVQLEAGLSEPLQPKALTAYMSEQDFSGQSEESPVETPGPTPSPDTDTDADTDTEADGSWPDLSSLLDIGGASAGIYWPAAKSLDNGILETLGGVMIDDLASVTLLGSQETAAGAAGATVGARVGIDDADALAYDTEISAALHAASLQDNSALRSADLTAATAQLMLAGANSGGAALLVTVDRDFDRSSVALRTAILAAAEAPGFAATDLSTLLAASERRMQLVEAEEVPERVAEAKRLLDDETALDRFATILDDSTLLTGPERAEVLQLLAVSWMTNQGWSREIDAHREQTDATLDSVALLPSSTINLLGSGAGLGFWVRNDLPYPVNVVLYTSPDDLRLDVQRATPVVATALSNTRVEVPVQARVANGEVTLTLQLRSRASVAIGDAEYVQVNVRAEWEAFGIGALAVVVGGLLIVGVIRTVRRTRARGHEVTPPEAPPSALASDERSDRKVEE